MTVDQASNGSLKASADGFEKGPVRTPCYSWRILPIATKARTEGIAIAAFTFISEECQGQRVGMGPYHVPACIEY